MPLFEPLVAAKLGATIDLIGNGRFGINVVSGWNESEMRMFGKTNPPHDERYAIADEWLTLVERLWTEGEEFDFDAKYFTASKAYLAPRPVQAPRPIIVQAGSSPAGTDFAARHADFGFNAFPDLGKLTALNSGLKTKAAGYGRDIGVINLATVVCADTEAEARPGLRVLRRQAGRLRGGGEPHRGTRRRRHPLLVPGCLPRHDAWTHRGRGRLPVVGTPEQIVDSMLALPLMVEAGLQR